MLYSHESAAAPPMTMLPLSDTHSRTPEPGRAGDSLYPTYFLPAVFFLPRIIAQDFAMVALTNDLAALIGFGCEAVCWGMYHSNVNCE